jgi:hypothetical protein
MAKGCRCKKSECEECPEWIFTFADLVMLMMGFFVILWVLKTTGKPAANETTPTKDMINVAAAVRSAFGYVPKAGSMDPVDQKMILDQMSQPKIPDGPGQGGKTKIRPDGAEGTDREVQSVRLGMQAIVGTRVIFEHGEAVLTPTAIEQLGQIAPPSPGGKRLPHQHRRRPRNPPRGRLLHFRARHPTRIHPQRPNSQSARGSGKHANAGGRTAIARTKHPGDAAVILPLGWSV